MWTAGLDLRQKNADKQLPASLSAGGNVREREGEKEIQSLSRVDYLISIQTKTYCL